MLNRTGDTAAINALRGASILLVSLGFPAAALSQSTPAELADLSLEDLLNLDVPEMTDDTSFTRWSLSYSYKHLNVGRYQSGGNDISFDDVLFSPGETRTALNYPIVPTFIDQQVHAASATYAITNSTSLGVLLPYISQATNHISSVPGFDEFLLSTDGFGDIAFTVGYQKRLSVSSAVRANVGVRLPTGSIDEMGDTPRNGAGSLERLPYTMQLGSGTYDLTFSLHYNYAINGFSFGANINSTIRTGLNENGYRLGDNHGVVIWSQFTRHYWLQPGIRLGVRHIDAINGRDDSLLAPGAFSFPASITDPDNYGGEKTSAAVTLKACANRRCKYNLMVEFGTPIYQNLNGVQPKERYNLSVTTGFQF